MENHCSVEQEQRRKIPMEVRLIDGALFTNDFAAFWEAKEHVFLRDKELQSKLHAGIIDIEDVKNEVFIIWTEKKDAWDPDRSAFHTYLMNQFHYALKQKYKGLKRSTQDPDSSETNEEFLDREWAETEKENPSDDEETELFELAMECFASDKEALHAYLRSLPGYQKKNFRVFIDHFRMHFTVLGQSATDASRLAAEELGLTERRSRQIRDEVVNYIQMGRERMVMDNKILRDHAGENAATLHYRKVEEFRIYDRFPENQIHAMARTFYTTTSCPFPVTSDQYFRVLDSRSALIIQAATYLGVVAVPHILHFIRDCSGEDDDPVFLRVRSQFILAFEGKPYRTKKKRERLSLLTNS